MLGDTLSDWIPVNTMAPHDTYAALIGRALEIFTARFTKRHLRF